MPKNNEKWMETNSMKPFILLILALLLTACGSAGASDPMNQAPSNKNGVSLAPEYHSGLQDYYVKVQECAQLQGQPFEELEIEILPFPFHCPEETRFGCSADFTPPNKFMVSSAPRFQHVLVHYLLHFNFGDQDFEHKSDLFEKCELKRIAPPQH